jgi:flagellar hook-basal body complex protein FliE
MASPLSAANTYASIAKLTAGLTKPAASEAGAGNFGDLLKDALNAVNETGKKSDAQAVAAVQGKGNMVDVVTAVADTEVAIDAVVAIRDRVIQAYEDIMKMPI